MYDFITRRKRVIKFIIAGGAAAAVELASLYFFTEILGIWYLFSASLGFIMAFFISFFLQKFWTFRDADKERMYKQMSIYFGMAVLNLMINALLMYVFVEGFKLWYMLAQVIAGGLIACESYLINKLFIFQETKTGHGLARAEDSGAGRGKILIATGIYPPDIGGPATLLHALPGALKEQGFKIKIITYSDIKGTAEERREGIIRILRKRNYFLRHFLYFGWMAYFIFWCDIIYVTDLYSAGRLAYLAKKIFRKKYIVRFAGDSAWEKASLAGLTEDDIMAFEEKKQPLALEKLKTARCLVLKNADRVISVSNFMAALAKKISVSPEKIRVIYNSVDFFNSFPERAESANPVLVFSGRLVPWKDQSVILKILPALMKIYPEIIFEVLGDGPGMEKLKKTVKDAGLENHVRIRGRLSEAETHAVFSRAAIFVLNTNYEGLPHSVLNAMQAGLPVITTRIGGNPEVIADGQDGLLVDYNNEKAWQEAIRKLLAEKKLRERLAANAKKKLMNFSWEKLVSETVKIFEEVLK